MSTSPVSSAEAPAAAASSPLLGQAWGVAALLALFGFGAYRLIGKGVQLVQSEVGVPITALDYFIVTLALLFGVAKAEFLFRRKFVPRTLARARDELRSADTLLAPLVLLSLTRPWKRAHQIMSFVLIPVMIGLAVAFVVIVPDSPFKAAVDLGIGAALAVAALAYLIALVRWLAWAVAGAVSANHPFPSRQSLGLCVNPWAFDQGGHRWPRLISSSPSLGRAGLLMPFVCWKCCFGPIAPCISP